MFNDTRIVDVVFVFKENGRSIVNISYLSFFKQLKLSTNNSNPN